jgi:hypothetical protein
MLPADEGYLPPALVRPGHEGVPLGRLSTMKSRPPEGAAAASHFPNAVTQLKRDRSGRSSPGHA